MGLVSSQEGEDAWLNANVGGRPSPLADSEGGWQRAWKGDVNPEALADQDSRFLKIDHITVHYKVADSKADTAAWKSGNANSTC